MGYEFLLREDRNGFSILTLNRPDKHNALSIALRGELVSALEDLASNDEIHCVILTGAGGTFCAGFDLKEFSSGNMEKIFADANIYHHKVFTFKKPLIAAINGSALAGGMDLALMCDLRIASDKALFGQPQVRMGVPAAFDLALSISSRAPWPTSPIQRLPLARSKEKRHGLRRPQAQRSLSPLLPTRGLSDGVR